MENSDHELLRLMAEKITQIEIRAKELQHLGHGLPVIEKNARDILHTVYVLKFGISDVADVEFP